MKQRAAPLEDAASLPPALSSAAMNLYRHVLRCHVMEVSEAPAVTESDEVTADEAIRSLLALGLLRRIGTDRLTAIAPSGRSAELLQAHESRLMEEWRRLGLLRDQILALTHLHETASGYLDQPLERLTSLPKVREALSKLAVNCTQEVLTSQPGGPRPKDVLSESADRDLDLLERGVRLRTLYQHAARFDPATSRHAARLSAAGAEIRTVTGGLTRFLVFDREVTVIPLDDLPGGALIVRDPAISSFSAELFELLWPRGQSFGIPLNRTFVEGLADQTKQAIMHLLVQGEDDRAVARALGVSVRTCQRHVSEIMTKLGAETRLHLGYLIREHNLLED
ncbi:LuxR family transcriptional regulator [Streptomyces sp. AJS327]|uniref:helix-turn-helix transcriptional regulator n=1 Tax=Streptomyces sp. AJS327 TaxID=2545265 RepID=UPI0015DFF83A|nr:helix-turn-helix transcriptional regulator [Streptomyces sp. AJS327]MBA0051705.1 LuxR family transcriptional regulator [Streptomyces sp. AJS327]